MLVDMSVDNSSRGAAVAARAPFFARRGGGSSNGERLYYPQLVRCASTSLSITPRNMAVL